MESAIAVLRKLRQTRSWTGIGQGEGRFDQQ
jgi:hypothetical protein